MSNVVSVPRGCGYFITQSGRDAYASEASCDCTYELRGRLIVCTQCGTAWAVYTSPSWLTAPDKKP